MSTSDFQRGTECGTRSPELAGVVGAESNRNVEPTLLGQMAVGVVVVEESSPAGEPPARDRHLATARLGIPGPERDSRRTGPVLVADS